MKKNLLFLSIVTLVIFLLPALLAATSHFSLFPLFYYHSDQQGKELLILYPFINYQATKAEKRVAFPPLFSLLKSDGEEAYLSFHFLWPFFRYESKGLPKEEYITHTATLSPLLEWYSMKKRELVDKRFTLIPLIFLGSQGEGRNYFVLFPLFWWAKDAKIYIPFYSTRRQSSFAIFPIYGWFKNLWGREKITFFLWPVLCLSHDKDSARFHLFWPIFNFIKKKEGFAFRIWPLFGYAREKNRLRKLYLLWPLIHHQRLWTKEGEGPDKIDMVLPFWINYKGKESQIKYIFPFFGTRKTPGIKRTSYFWPIFTITESIRRKTKEWGFLFSLFRYKKGPGEKSIEIYPLFKYHRRPTQRRAYFLWPFFSYKTDILGEERYTSRYIPPLFIYKLRTGRNQEVEDKRLIICPFFRTHFNRYLGTRTQLLWPLWYDDIKGMKRNYERLWTLYYTDEAAAEKTVWGKLYFQKHREEKIRKEWNLLLFNYYSDPEMQRYSILGGLFGVEKHKDQKIFRLFFLPVKI